MIRATKYMCDIVYNLRDVCVKLGVKYDEVINKSKIKNTITDMEYARDSNDEYWLSRGGLHIAFYNSNKREEYLNLIREI